MQLFRLTFLWVCSTSMILSSVLNQGFVVCITADGQVRVEASGKNGKCYQSSSTSDEHANNKNFKALTASPLHACDDLAVGERTSPLLTYNIKALSQFSPLLSTTVAAFADIALTSSFVRFSKHAVSSLDPPILSDTFFVRKTVALHI